MLEQEDVDQLLTTKSELRVALKKDAKEAIKTSLENLPAKDEPLF